MVEFLYLIDTSKPLLFQKIQMTINIPWSHGTYNIARPLLKAVGLLLHETDKI